MAAGTDIDLAVNDLGPLAWVLDELRKLLDTASGALRRFVRDADAARGSDIFSKPLMVVCICQATLGLLNRRGKSS